MVALLCTINSLCVDPILNYSILLVVRLCCDILSPAASGVHSSEPRLWLTFSIFWLIWLLKLTFLVSCIPKYVSWSRWYGHIWSPSSSPLLSLCSCQRFRNHRNQIPWNNIILKFRTAFSSIMSIGTKECWDLFAGVMHPQRIYLFVGSINAHRTWFLKTSVLPGCW